jgi:hypothetical protein
MPPFLKRLAFCKTEKSYCGGTWTTIYPSDAVERNLVENNKEWIFIADR